MPNDMYCACVYAVPARACLCASARVCTRVCTVAVAVANARSSPPRRRRTSPVWRAYAHASANKCRPRKYQVRLQSVRRANRRAGTALASLLLQWVDAHTERQPVSTRHAATLTETPRSRCPSACREVGCSRRDARPARGLPITSVVFVLFVRFCFVLSFYYMCPLAAEICASSLLFFSWSNFTSFSAAFTVFALV